MTLKNNLNELAFSDKFKLTAKITLEGVDKPYTLEMPMQQSVEKATALKPNMTKKHGNLSVTLSKLNLTSDSSRTLFKPCSAPCILVRSKAFLYFYDNIGTRIGQTYRSSRPHHPTK